MELAEEIRHVLDVKSQRRDLAEGWSSDSASIPGVTINYICMPCWLLIKVGAIP